MLRWLPTAFDSIKTQPDTTSLDLYPANLASKIDELTVWINRDLNTGVYKAGFAKDQETYDKNVIPVFGALNKLEKIISSNGGPYILGKTLTELDIRTYATIVRFDVVYVQHFKCNLGTIRSHYPVTLAWLQNLYWNVPGFKESTNFKHIKENYTKSHYDINPHAITPLGPVPDVPELGGKAVDISKILVGGVNLEAVIQHEKSL